MYDKLLHVTHGVQAKADYCICKGSVQIARTPTACQQHHLVQEGGCMLHKSLAMDAM